MSETILKIEDLQVNYGGIEAVKGISFDVQEGQIVTLIGSNGAGKSSTLRTISEKYGFELLGIITPREWLRLLRSPRAIALGTNRSSRTASSTRRRASSLTRRVPLMTCETVVTDTPARYATSLIVFTNSPVLCVHPTET